MIPFNNFNDVPGAENAYLVGGCVRDSLLGRRPQDYDIAVSPPVRGFAENLSRKIGGHCFDLGQPGRQIIRIIAGDIMLDVSPINGPDIEADLQKRDFTVNALAFHVGSGQTIDCTGGIKDLQKKTVRMVSARSFTEDPVRLIRAYRMAALLNFTIDPATSAAIATLSPLIQTTAGERIHTELIKLLEAKRAFPYIKQMARDALLFAVIPELEALKGCRQNRHHPFDAWEHTMKVFDHMETILAHHKELLPAAASELSACLENDAPTLLKISALLHDIGKPATRKETGVNTAIFHGHDQIGAEMAEIIARRLRFSTKETQVVTHVIRHHLAPLTLFINDEKTPRENDRTPQKAVTRCFMRCGRLTPLILLHALADHRGKQHGGALNEDDFTRFIQKLLTAYFTDFQRKITRSPLVTGHDLILEFGLKPAPEFKEILDRVEEARLSGEAATREEGLRIVEDFLKAHELRAGPDQPTWQQHAEKNGGY